MSAVTSAPQRFDTAAPTEASDPPRRAIQAAIGRTTRRIAPLWPLDHFVAVNPFLGLADRDFTDAARTMAQVAGARMVMPRHFYAEAIESGRIGVADLAEALAEARPIDGLPRTSAALASAARADHPGPGLAIVPTVADVATRVTGHEWAPFVTDRISSWAAGYFDPSRAAWGSPWRDLAPFAAWRGQACLDRTPELMGIPGFRAFVRRLPDVALEASAISVQRLGIPPAALETYLHRLLMSIGGWAAHARYRVWRSERDGERDDSVAELLAVRLAWDLALLDAFASRGLAEAWAAARDELTTRPAGEPSLTVDLALHAAYEKAWQRDLVSRLSARKPDRPAARKLVQAAFCIDVRSEIFRRALETVDPETETLGVGGFFGVAIEYVRLGQATGRGRCPVLISPTHVIREAVKGSDEAGVVHRKRVARRFGHAWRSFKFAAVSSFGFVETMGLGFAGKLIADSIGLAGRARPPGNRRSCVRLGPVITRQEVDGLRSGLDAAERIALAAAVLESMSMTDGFARLVVFIGHGATTVNNPHATALHCGACGGHTGEANARVAAAVLNEPAVRAGLAGKGISIPDDTVFVAGLHDTTTDEVTIFDREEVPPGRARELDRLEARLAAAARVARAERAQRLNLEGRRSLDAAVIARSRDWSQVRPEWGLAGCAAFIAAPRQRTRGVDLGGRSFLHSYDWRQDQGFAVLELIMTAPMVVASWISLQYYGSTVDNRVFGSGNKVLHDVVGTIGVIEGSGGDLRVGLPWQSVHDGERFIHEPVRLSVLIEAPIAAMNAVIARHESVRQLVDHGWLHLFALDEAGAVAQRYMGELTWEAISRRSSRQAA